VTTYLYDANQDMRAEMAAVDAERDLTGLLAGADRVPLAAPEGVAAGFVHTPGQDAGVLVAHGLADLDPTQTYQLWLIHDGQPVAAGVFRPAGDGPTIVPAEAQVLGAELVAVTVEPAGGVAEPTGSVLISGEL
jgi:hypothetical protein